MIAKVVGLTWLSWGVIKIINTAQPSHWIKYVLAEGPFSKRQLASALGAGSQECFWSLESFSLPFATLAFSMVVSGDIN